MKALLIGKIECSGARRIQEEFEKCGVEFAKVASENVIFEVRDDNARCFSSSGIDFADYDVLFFRGMRNKINEFSIIARYFKGKGKVVIEDILTTQTIHFGKFTPSMVDDRIPTPDYYILFDERNNFPRKAEYPIIVKRLDGSRGDKVSLVHSESEFKETVEKYGYPVMLQKYMPITCDYRVMVVDGEPLGAVARFNTEYSFLTNQRGGKRENITLPERALELARRATKISGLMIAGVDLIEQNGEYYLLEVNMSPQFKVFEEVTGVNVAKKIVDAIMRRYERQEKKGS